MILKSVKYVEYSGEPQEWKIDLTLRQENLFVGENASGKSKAITLISSLASILSGRLKPAFLSSEWKAEFQDGTDHYAYEVRVRGQKVIEETFTKNGNPLLSRGAGGAGTIYFQKMNVTDSFQTPDSDLAATVRQDKAQHPFLDALDSWGNSFFFYMFGTPLGRDTLTMLSFSSPPPPINLHDSNAVTAIFRKATKDFGSEFSDKVKAGMEELGYPIDDVSADPPQITIFQGLMPAQMVCISVKERDLECRTEQYTMSQGMFRALSIIIQTTYLRMTGKAGCIAVDDIGEGLDYDRSCRMIEFLRTAAAESNLQLIMTTNDRFVMNKVPLESWSLLKREGKRCGVFNYDNSKAKFDEFKFTGFSNFDFFKMDFMQNGLDEEGVSSGSEAK